MVFFTTKKHIQQSSDSKHETHPEPLNGLLNTAAQFEVSGLNRGRPWFHRVAMAYIDNNAYEILENPEGADYDMWECCVVQLFSYGKPNQQYPEHLSERVKLYIDYERLLNRVHQSADQDISVLAPRAWPHLSFLFRRWAEPLT